MKLEDTGVTFLDLTSDPAQPGISVCEFNEGIERKTNEKSGKTTLRLPLTITKVLEGPEDNEGRKMSHFCPIETSYGEKQLSHILILTRLVKQFLNHLGSNVDVQGEEFLNYLKLKLPGKQIQVTHNIRKDSKDRDQVNISRLEAWIDKPESVKSPKKAVPEAKATSGGGDEDWG